MHSDEVYFCPRCGAEVAQAERFGRLRKICPRCEWIHFADPKVAAAVLVERGEEVLLVRRAVDPLRGMWTLPAGFVDAGEDPARAAERECLEETGLHVRVTDLLDVIYGLEHPRGAHFIIIYQAEVVAGELTARDDVDQAAFFSRSSLPPLAFHSTQQVLGLVDGS